MTFKTGDYVRMKAHPQTRMGTIGEERETDAGGLNYGFVPDPRIYERFGADGFIPEDDLELCPRPSDDEVRVINAIIKQSR